MAIREHIVLVELMHRLTSSNKIDWQASPSDSYIANINGNIVSIKSEDSKDFNQDIYINIYDKDGNIVDTFSDVSLTQDGYENAFEIMRLLHEMARRNALGSDKILNSIIESLKRKL